MESNNGIMMVDGTVFGVELKFAVSTPTGVTAKTMTLCNFRRYGFSVQEGGIEENSGHRGTAQICSAVYGRYLTTDNVWACFNSTVMQLLLRYPEAAPVINSEEFRTKVAKMLDGTFAHHGLKSGFVGDLTHWQVFSDFRATGT